ncbi:MAG: RdgB/HAM1 family non-canonical purine NTP pyrophosphatase [Planctomycetota bacterium]
MAPLFVATSNSGKLLELRELVAGLDITLESPGDLPPHDPPLEQGHSFEENARLKATFYARLTGRITLADDSGLVVDALGGLPGVYSARFSGDPPDSERNIDYLLARLRGVPEAQRGARFVCVVVVAGPAGVLEEARGEVEGRLLTERRGRGGFGYDPIFYYPPAGLTFAELDPALKNQVSHRARALRGIAPRLASLLRIHHPATPFDPAR